MAKVKPGVSHVLGLCMFLSLTGSISGDVYASEGKPVTLHYYTERPVSVSWHYKTVSENVKWMEIAIGSKYQASTDMSGTHHMLAITEVQLEDAGRYRCIDSEGEKGSIELIVTDDELKCEWIFEDKHLEDEQLELDRDHQGLVKIQCNIMYNGNKHPSLQWLLVKDGSILNRLPLQLHTHSSRIALERYMRITSEIKLSASRWLDRSTVLCRLIDDENLLNDNPEIWAVRWLSQKIFIKCIDSAECFFEFRHAAVIETDEGVHGIAIMDEKIFLLDSMSAKISLYNTYTLKFWHSIDISHFGTPKGMCSSAWNKRMYMSSIGYSYIYRIDLNTKGTTGWKIAGNQSPVGLSMTEDDTLLVTVWIQGTGRSGRECGVVEYTGEGQLVLEIRFDDSVSFAWETERLSKNEYVVVHYSDDSSLHRVCLVDMEGRIQRSFGGTAGSGDDRLHAPMSLSVDRNGKLIYVADTKNSRVIILDFNLIYQGLVRAQLSLNVPLSVFFDPSSKRLLVGDLTGRVLIFSPSQLV